VLLRTDAIDVDLPATGPMEVRVTRPHGEILGRATLDSGATVGLGGLDASSVHYTAGHYSSGHAVPGVIDIATWCYGWSSRPLRHPPGTQEICSPGT
jgi:hypothetical protein